jgi:hypothetical protein
LGDLNRFDTPGEMREASYRHIHYYNHQCIHTALKMSPIAYARQFNLGYCLHELGT